mmetsp:Transcript_18067/g.55308  ORF Transcript_18067/g.55308 Transcript_18067/m.55308 type:complete len:1191 (-) Transcript_18067:637-4209(-)|eukprot:CAMPEP_0198674642 /NCGR_PEP_ID=MMETSP1467-20131203/98016_1 /TAXON_ID=1462469 /ORGANISM="unid. sp., Strain CCMP2135" /LENGTH=1190 /DNA_ID=CAMNT_0044411541 /DNA_START=40 /DNA_END=3612 /DNA_ORIENTATION=+
MELAYPATLSTEYEDEHEAFAASRSTAYIYEVSNDSLYGALDSHAEAVDSDVALPLVVTGAIGSGKSALLANWVKRRRSCTHSSEFLFQHFVCASTRSRQLSHLLFRVESALKEHFQLREMEVPMTEERLRWSLNRFLAAAAKKQVLARIVIVLDAVNRLRGESSSADTLHWLPTKLPHGVRIIVSTLELEQSGLHVEDSYDDGSTINRTYTELQRRRCPSLRLQPLSVEVRHLIIGKFLQLNQRSMPVLEQAQQFRLVTAKASSQPLFLRTILYALRLGVELSNAALDAQIDTCLATSNAPDLLARVLDLCSEYVNYSGKPTISQDVAFVNHNVLAQILSAIHVSRHGLTETEMWGIVKLATGKFPTTKQRNCIQRVLRDFTFSVHGLKNFSHEDYAVVVYRKYIRLVEVNIRAHHLLARYFKKLPPCDRKLTALPYHLEVAGSWSQLRIALADVRMFCLWWTPSHKREFLNLWASLTSCSRSGPMCSRKFVTCESDDTIRCKQAPRPCLDVVEEYVVAVDHYRYSQHPGDNELSAVILKVADFMLEFSTLSLENAVHIPLFAHPFIPIDDLASLGVPFLTRDRDGNSVLNSPCVASPTQMTTLVPKNLVDVSLKGEDILLCSTYFYHRWMWIQFPWVGLANCNGSSIDRRFHVEKNQHVPESSFGEYSNSILQDLQCKQLQCVLRSSPKSCSRSVVRASTICLSKVNTVEHISSSSTAQISCLRKGDLLRNCVIHHGGATLPLSDCTYDAVSAGTNAAGVQVLRNQLAHLRHESSSLRLALRRVQGSALSLSRLMKSTNIFHTKLNCLTQRQEQICQGMRMAALLHDNYDKVKMMCKRHPAQNVSLIAELELKLSQDSHFLEEVRVQHQDMSFDLRNDTANIKALQRAARSTNAQQSEIVAHIAKDLDAHNVASSAAVHSKVWPPHASCGAYGSSMSSQVPGVEQGYIDLAHNGEFAHQSDFRVADVVDAKVKDCLQKWTFHGDTIRKRTFLSQLSDFFQKYQNAHVLKTQMNSLHEALEGRLRERKSFLSTIHAELEQFRYRSQSVIGTNSREARELQTRTLSVLAKQRRLRELALGAERLRQAAFGGVKHVCAMLGIPSPDQDTPVNEIIHQVESVLEALMEEKDKTMQKASDAHQFSVREAKLGNDKVVRAPELDAALALFERPKALIAHRLVPKLKAKEIRCTP